MRRGIAGLVLLALLGCYEPVPPSDVVWENTISSRDGLQDEVRVAVALDTSNSFDGDGSLMVHTAGESVFFLYALEGDALTTAPLEKRLISYQARLRTADLDGEARIELGVRLADGTTYRAVPDMPPLSGTTDWVMQEANFFAAGDEKPDGIFLMLGVTGPGRVWIDHLKVLSTPPRGG